MLSIKLQHKIATILSMGIIIIARICPAAYDAVLFSEAWENATITEGDRQMKRLAELQRKCRELDSYGGSAMVSPEMDAQANSWIEAKFSATPSAYIKSISKGALLRDRKRKEGQDVIMGKIAVLRTAVQIAYRESLALGLAVRDFDKVAIEYKKIIQSRAWRDPTIGNQAVSANARGVRYGDKSGIDKNIRDLSLSIISIYQNIIEEKENRRREYLSGNPQVERDFQTEQTIKRLEERTAAAERRARQAAFDAAAAREEAAEASQSAYEARQGMDNGGLLNPRFINPGIRSIRRLDR